MRSIQEMFSGHRASRGGEYVGRFRANDQMMTFDHQVATVDQGQPVAAGKKLPFPAMTTDGEGRTRTCDSTGAFLVGELERLDMKLHDPLAAVTWGRDIDLREDATIADEVTSFTVSSYGSAGGLGTGNSIGNGKAWMGKNTDQIGGVGLDIGKLVSPLRLWGLELKYTIPELESAARLGRPVDVQKFQGMQLKYQMDVDEQVYMGDTATGDTGLINRAGISTTNVVTGASGFTTWANKSPLEILADVNTALVTTWTNAVWAVMSNRILIPPAQYGYISTEPVTLAGSKSILQYLLENNLLARQGGQKLEILPLKWAIGAGVGGTIGTLGTVDRMIVYQKEYDRVRFPITTLQRTPIQYDSIYHKTTYFGRIGVMEFVYPQCVSYWDGI